MVDKKDVVDTLMLVISLMEASDPMIKQDKIPTQITLEMPVELARILSEFATTFCKPGKIDEGFDDLISKFFIIGMSALVKSWVKDLAEECTCGKCKGGDTD